MGQQLIVILALLLMVRPITLVENFACGVEVVGMANTVPTILKPMPPNEIPCPDTPQPSEIVESSHSCPCFALLQPDSANPTAGTNTITQVTHTANLVETAVATPPTPPPRLV